MEAKMSKGDMIKWAINFIIPIIIFLIPCNDVFTMKMKLFFVTTVFAILCFALETMNQTLVALLVPVLWVYLGVAPAATVFSPWTQYIPWSVLAGLLMANVLESTGLLKRISYMFIYMTGGTYFGLVMGAGIVATLLTIFVGNVVYPMAALAYGLCMALNLGKSKGSAGIMLAIAMGCLVTNCTKMLGPLLMMGIGKDITGPLQFLGFFEAEIVNAPVFVELIVMFVICGILFKPDTPVEGKTYFKAQLDAMGKMSVREIKALVLTVFYLLYVVTKDIHGLSVEWGITLIPLLFCCPVIGPGSEQDIKRLNFGFVIFVTCCMGIGSVAVSLGIGGLLVQVIMPYLTGASHYVFFLIEWFMLMILNFVMTPLAMEAAFTVPLASIGTAMGINPMAIYYFMMNAVDQIILPYEYALYMISFAFGLIHMKDFMKCMAIKMVVNFVMCFALLLPWWNFMGFLFK